jgi:hypothetical protein
VAPINVLTAAMPGLRHNAGEQEVGDVLVFQQLPHLSDGLLTNERLDLFQGWLPLVGGTAGLPQAVGRINPLNLFAGPVTQQTCQE